MAITTLTAHAFCLAIGNARSATRDGPVIIVDEAGRPAHVLLSFEEYRRMGGLLERQEQQGLTVVADASAESIEPDAAARQSEIDPSPWAFMLEALEEFEAEAESPKDDTGEPIA